MQSTDFELEPLTFLRQILATCWQESKDKESEKGLIALIQQQRMILSDLESQLVNAKMGQRKD